MTISMNAQLLLNGINFKLKINLFLEKWTSQPSRRSFFILSHGKSTTVSWWDGSASVNVLYSLIISFGSYVFCWYVQTLRSSKVYSKGLFEIRQRKLAQFSTLFCHNCVFGCWSMPLFDVHLVPSMITSKRYSRGGRKVFCQLGWLFSPFHSFIENRKTTAHSTHRVSQKDDDDEDLKSLLQYLLINVVFIMFIFHFLRCQFSCSWPATTTTPVCGTVGMNEIYQKTGGRVWFWGAMHKIP